MKGFFVGALAFALASAGVAQSFSYDFEALAPGNIIGQDGWSVLEAGSASAIVDKAVYSPMGASTKSLKMSGGTTSTRIGRFLGMTFSAGPVHVGYDMRHSPR